MMQPESRRRCTWPRELDDEEARVCGPVEPSDEERQRYYMHIEALAVPAQPDESMSNFEMVLSLVGLGFTVLAVIALLGWGTWKLWGG